MFLSFIGKPIAKDYLCEAVRYLLAYCLLKPESRWKDENRFFMMVQSIFLDINISSEL